MWEIPVITILLLVSFRLTKPVKPRIHYFKRDTDWFDVIKEARDRKVLK